MSLQNTGIQYRYTPPETISDGPRGDNYIPAFLDWTKTKDGCGCSADLRLTASSNYLYNYEDFSRAFFYGLVPGNFVAPPLIADVRDIEITAWPNGKLVLPNSHPIPEDRNYLTNYKPFALSANLDGSFKISARYRFYNVPSLGLNYPICCLVNYNNEDAVSDSPKLLTPVIAADPQGGGNFVVSIDHPYQELPRFQLVAALQYGEEPYYPQITFRYTTDGTEPNNTSTAYDPFTPPVLEYGQVYQIKVKAFSPGWTASDTASAVISANYLLEQNHQAPNILIRNPDPKPDTTQETFDDLTTLTLSDRWIRGWGLTSGSSGGLDTASWNIYNVGSNLNGTTITGTGKVVGLNNPPTVGNQYQTTLVKINESKQDFDLIGRFQIGSVTVQKDSAGLVLRASGGGVNGVGYVAALGATGPANAHSLSISKWINGVRTQLGTIAIGGTLAPDTAYFIRFKIAGRKLKAKFWTGSLNSEPSVWGIELEDTSIASSGSYGIFSNAGMSCDYLKFSDNTLTEQDVYNFNLDGLNEGIENLRFALTITPPENYGQADLDDPDIYYSLNGGVSFQNYTDEFAIPSGWLTPIGGAGFPTIAAYYKDQSGHSSPCAFQKFSFSKANTEVYFYPYDPNAVPLKWNLSSNRVELLSTLSNQGDGVQLMNLCHRQTYLDDFRYFEIRPSVLNDPSNFFKILVNGVEFRQDGSVVCAVITTGGSTTINNPNLTWGVNSVIRVKINYRDSAVYIKVNTDEDYQGPYYGNRGTYLDIVYSNPINVSLDGTVFDFGFKLRDMVFPLSEQSVLALNTDDQEVLPQIVSGLQSSVSNDVVTLNWDPSLNSTGYNIYVSTNVNDSDIDFYYQGYLGNTIQINDLPIGPTYYFRVSGTNGYGEGTLSSQISATPTDPPIPGHLVSLLHFNTTTGSQNFIDETGLVWTANGNVTISEDFTLFPGVKLLKSVNGGYISANDPELLFGTGAFTIEFWIKAMGYPSLGYGRGIGQSGTNTDSVAGIGFELFRNGQGNTHLFGRQGNGNIATFSQVTSIPTNFAHLAACSNGTRAQLFYQGQPAGVINNLNELTSQIFRWGVSAGTWPSNSSVIYIAEPRIWKGGELYTGPFTPPSAPFTP